MLPLGPLERREDRADPRRVQVPEQVPGSIPRATGRGSRERLHDPPVAGSVGGGDSSSKSVVIVAVDLERDLDGFDVCDPRERPTVKGSNEEFLSGADDNPLTKARSPVER